MRKSARYVAIAALALACAKKNTEVKEPAVTDPGIQSTGTTTGSTWESPGGMWMPQQIPGHAEPLKTLGLELPPSALSDPKQPPLAAVIWLGGCTASFVSPEGLIVTNHHCVTGALQVNSTPEKNLAIDGFHAKTRAEEVSAGASARVYVASSFSDVSDRMLAGLEDETDDRKRFDLIEKREKAMVAECEKDRPGTRCRIAAYYEGAEWQLIEQIEIRDVRLVYAPPGGVGVFGGEVDNWMWPRHTGDFSFYRAYVGPDGKPADFAKENVPYKPPHFLKVSAGGLEEGDLVMVAGYPGRTYRHQTAHATDTAVSWRYPRSIAAAEEYLKVLEEASKIAPEVEIKATPYVRGLGNSLKNNQGMVEGLEKGGLAAERTKIEQGLAAWIEQDPDRKARYGGVLERMTTLAKEQEKHRERDAAAGELFRYSQLLSTAISIVRMAEERPKADADRKPGYQERDWKRSEQGLAMMDLKYDQRLDRALLTTAMKRAARQPEADRPAALYVLVGKKGGEVTDAEIEKSVARLYSKPTLEKKETRIDLYRKATVAQLKKSKDPVIQAALAMVPMLDDMENRDKSYSGAMAILRPKYMAALREYSQGTIAPDANGTLRVTFGTVRGYTSKKSGTQYTPFTWISEMVAKHTGEEPFDVPDPVLQAVKEQKFGPYTVAPKNEVPVNFLSDVDTTGGNSGSPTLNGKGELVGLLFDGNYESMASDWVFIPSITRAIHCDIRYVLWLMDTDGADALLTEMGVEPAIP